MTYVRRKKLTIKRQPSVNQPTQTRLRNETRLRNRGTLGDPICGRVNPRALSRTPLFLSRRCKSTASRLAGRLRIAADVDLRRRAFANQHITMRERNDNTTTDAQMFDLQRDDQLDHDLSNHPQRFDAFDGSDFQPSNEKTRDGGGELTRLTDLTANEKGVYVADTRPHPRPGAPGLYTSLPFRSRQIRQIRQTARRQGVDFTPLPSNGVSI